MEILLILILIGLIEIHSVLKQINKKLKGGESNGE